MYSLQVDYQISGYMSGIEITGRLSDIWVYVWCIITGRLSDMSIKFSMGNLNICNVLGNLC